MLSKYVEFYQIQKIMEKLKKRYQMLKKYNMHQIRNNTDILEDFVSLFPTTLRGTLLKNVYRNVFKVSQKSIPQNFTDEMINQMMEDKNMSIQMFTSMKRTNPLIQLDMNSFTSKLINGLKFYKIKFKNGMENNISLFTIHKRKMFFIYFTYLNLVDGEMSEFENILKSIIIK